MPEYTDKFLELADAQVASDQYPTLKSVTLAQWILESGRGSSDLAEMHDNFGGLKWRDRMQGFAVPVEMVTPSEPQGATWCKFRDPPAYIPGYWQFIESGPYEDPARYADNPRAYLEMLHDCGYATDPGYVDKVWSLEPEARQLLIDRGATVPSPEPEPPAGPQTKLAIVVGHNTRKPGAYSAELGENEHPFNTRVADIMAGLAGQYGFEVQVFHRRSDISSTTAEIEECYRRVNAWIPSTRDGLCGELHFNAFNERTGGCEMLYWHTSTGGPVVAQHLQDGVLSSFSLNDRGIKANDGSQAGSVSLRSCATYNVVLEPVFGDYRPDAAQVRNREATLARVYLQAYYEAAVELGLMQPAVPSPPTEPEPPMVEPPEEPAPPEAPYPEGVMRAFAKTGCQLIEQDGATGQLKLIYERPEGM